MDSKSSKSKSWDLIIKPRSGWLNINFLELYKYHDLIFLFVKRDFVTFYKQTILGPLWYIIQPLVNTLVFTVIFGKLAKIPTDGTPPFLFYLVGTVAWGYFATCIRDTSNIFVKNAQIFGKVYFPRLTVPISIVITSLFQFTIQFTIFTCFYLYFLMKGAVIVPSYLILLLPLLVFQMAILGLGMGILISSLVTKYRDLTFAMSFGIQIWMYMTPVVYPLSQVPEQYRMLYALNPMVSIIEGFRALFLGVSSIKAEYIIISVIVSIVIFANGIIMFSRIEKTFMDTI